MLELIRLFSPKYWLKPSPPLLEGVVGSSAMAMPLLPLEALMVRALLTTLTEAAPPRAVFRLETKVEGVKALLTPPTVMVPAEKSIATCCWMTPAELTTAMLVAPVNPVRAVGMSVPTFEPVNVFCAGTEVEALCALLRAFAVWVTNSLTWSWIPGKVVLRRSRSPLMSPLWTCSETGATPVPGWVMVTWLEPLLAGV